MGIYNFQRLLKTTINQHILEGYKMENTFNYIVKQFARTNKKNYENYVLTRIYHLLNRVDVKFVTQQYVQKADSSYSLTDLYFPQLKLHIEVDEPAHERQKIYDIKREQDIVKVTGHQIKRITITESLQSVNTQIDILVKNIKDQIQELEKENKWEPWDLDREYSIAYHKEKGYFKVSEEPSFLRIVDACNCLGQHYKNNVQGAYYKSKMYEGYYLWFPKFIENNDWDNSISDDGKYITEICKNKTKYTKWNPLNAKNDTQKRITFAKKINNLGEVLYKFVGVFQVDSENTSADKMVYKLVTDEFSM